MQFDCMPSIFNFPFFYVFELRFSNDAHLGCGIESIDETRLLFAHEILRLFVIHAQLQYLQNRIACR